VLDGLFHLFLILARAAVIRRSTAYHEAGHAVAQVACRGTIWRVSIAPSIDEQGRPIGGSMEGRPPWEQPAAKAPRGRLRGFTREVRAILRRDGIISFAGIAAQYPRNTGLCGDDMADRARLDIEGFHLAAKDFGCRRPRWTIHWPSFDRACAVIDPRWGQVEALAEALLERTTLLESEVLEIVAKAPDRRNNRQPWIVRRSGGKRVRWLEGRGSLAPSRERGRA